MRSTLSIYYYIFIVKLRNQTNMSIVRSSLARLSMSLLFLRLHSLLGLLSLMIPLIVTLGHLHNLGDGSTKCFQFLLLR